MNTNQTSPAIETRSLRKVYRSGFFRIPFVGLESLDLRVEPAEIFGFIGPNGAGKTTAIKCLVGLQASTSGQGSILGMDIADPETRRRLGFLPERPYFYQHLTAREFLDFQASLFDIPQGTRRARIEQLLELVELGRFADLQLRHYSKGMLQRAGLAQALVNEPQVVILDEPMSGLDPMGRMLVRDIILSQRRLGRTVFFSTHILSDVESICDRVGLIVGGSLRAIGRLDELLSTKILYVDVTIRAGSVPLERGELVATQGDARVLRLPPDHVDEFVRALIESGGSVLEITPARETLERLLLEEVRRNDPINKKHMGVLA